jgi:hypothetical protein
VLPEPLHLGRPDVTARDDLRIGQFDEATRESTTLSAQPDKTNIDLVAWRYVPFAEHMARYDRKSAGRQRCRLDESSS